MMRTTSDNQNGTFDVKAVCYGGCGRAIEQSNITAPHAAAAMQIGERQLEERDGWERGRCRDCLIHESGWQSNRAGTR